MTTRWDQNRVFIARRFFLAALLQLAAGILIAATLIAVNGRPPIRTSLILPKAFQYGTLCLAFGSWYLHQAVFSVRLERQLQFRRSLYLALVFAVMFVGVQSYGLWDFVKAVPESGWTQTDVNGFVFVFAAVHAMHFLVAQSVLLWVTLCAGYDRYDHEYYWGVVFAAWCWHGLGLVWLAILCVFAIVV